MRIEWLKRVVLLVPVVLPATAEDVEAQRYDACYAEKTGVIYMIDPSGLMPGDLPTECVKPNKHIQFDWVDADSADHSALLGLGNDDHPQYLPVDGSRGMAGKLKVNGVIETTGGLKFDDGTTQTTAATSAASPWAGYEFARDVQPWGVLAGDARRISMRVVCPPNKVAINGGYNIQTTGSGSAAGAGKLEITELSNGVVGSDPTSSSFQFIADVINHDTVLYNGQFSVWAVCVDAP